jgi:hypothetical protein
VSNELVKSLTSQFTEHSTQQRRQKTGHFRLALGGILMSIETAGGGNATHILMAGQQPSLVEKKTEKKDTHLQFGGKI